MNFPYIYFNDTDISTEIYPNYASVPYINLGEMVKDSNGFLSKNIYICNNYDKTLKNIKFYITEYHGSRPAEYIATESSPYIFTLLNNKLFIKLDNIDSIFSILFDTGTLTVQQVIDTINETVGLDIASDSSGKLKIVSSITGINSKIHIMNYSTALDILGLSSCNNTAISEGYYEKWGSINGVDYTFDGSPSINMNEVLLWGDLGCGLEIGYDSNFNRFTSSNGVKNNPITMNWGDGVSGSDLYTFIDGQNKHVINTVVRISYPDSDDYIYNTGFRGLTIACQYSYY